MFKKLTDFKYHRKTNEAIGFYLAYLLFVIVASGALGAFAGTFMGNGHGAYRQGLRIGTMIAMLTSCGLSFTILHYKKRLNNLGYIILACLSLLLASLGGAVLGLIIPAYFTTRK